MLRTFLNSKCRTAFKMISTFLHSLVLGAMCHQYMLWATIVLEMSLALTYLMFAFSLLICCVVAVIYYHEICDGYNMQMQLNRLVQHEGMVRILPGRMQDFSHRLAAKAA